MSETRLPDGWRWVKIADVCNRIDYGYTASADFKVQQPRFLRITDIQNGQVDWENAPGCEITPTEEQRNLLKDGDIVIARTGGTVGKSFLIVNPPRAVFASYLIRLQPSSTILPNYLYMFLQSDGYWDQIRQNARGGAQPNVNATLLGSTILPLPPLAEQQRIAAAIEAQMAEIDAARAGIEAELEAAEALTASYLREVFESDEAEEWEWTTIGQLSDLVSGGTPNRGNLSSFQGNIPWVKTLDLNLTYVTITEECISEGGFREIRGKLLPEGTVMIAMYGGGGTIGKSGILGIRATTNQAICAVLPNDELFLPEFLHAWILYIRPEWMKYSSGNRRDPNINKDIVSKMACPLPTLDRQHAIIDMLNEQLKTRQHIHTTLLQKLAAINAMPAAVLRRAFNGEL